MPSYSSEWVLLNPAVAAMETLTSFYLGVLESISLALALHSCQPLPGLFSRRKAGTAS